MIGKVISGRYQIIQSLGCGGFGQTFLAEDLQLPDHHKCVVKRLQPTSNENFIWEIASRLFEAEARVLHKLGNHDRIPRLLAHFAEAHEFYLVQELIDGYDLAHEITSVERSADGYPIGRMNQAQAIAFLIDVLEILTFVHQQGAIHRDLKPANLMRRHNDGRLVLIDFGAVKQVGTAISASAIGSTVAIGTDGYMPNEQAIGKPRPCSDLYAVGAIAIQGLTGVAPNLLSENLETGELAWRQSPDHAALKYRAQVSDELARIIDKLVKYDFRDRYQSAEAVLLDLQKIKEPIAPTLLSTTVQTHFPELTSAFNPNDDVATKFSPIASPKASPKTSPRDHLQFAYQNRLMIITVGIVSAIAVIGAVVFLRPSPAIKNDVNITASSSSPKYLFLSERVISDQDLAGKSALEIDIMRNEVFARYGRRFQDPELQSYFSNQPWYQPLYTPNQFPEELLTPIEIQNVTYIREFQNRTDAKYSASQNTANNLQNLQCDYTRRLVSDPQPPINVRQGAGVEFAIVGKLDNGTQITVQSEKQGWLKISAPIAGWIAANRTKPICL